MENSLTSLPFSHFRCWFPEDLAERKNFKGAMEEHAALADAMNVDDEPIQNERTRKMKKLLSQAILECVKIDRDVGIEIVDAYHKAWLTEMEVTDTDSFETLDDYLAFRRLSARVK
jgi:ophiobolin F synthase